MKRKTQAEINNAALAVALEQHYAAKAEKKRLRDLRVQKKAERKRRALDDKRVAEGRLPVDPDYRKKVIAQRDNSDMAKREQEWLRRSARYEKTVEAVTRKLESNEIMFSKREIRVVNDIARRAKHRYLLGATTFTRAEIRACGARRTEP